MKKWKERGKERWNEMLPYERKFAVASWVLLPLSLIACLVEILSYIGVLVIPFDIAFVTEGLVALIAGCGAVISWRKERSSAICLIVIAIWRGLDAIWEIVKLFD